MPRRAPLLLLLLPFALLASCRRGSPGAPPERWLSASAPAAVVLPELGRASRELAALADTLATFPGADRQVAGLRQALAAQLGLDLLDPESLARGGLDPQGGAALGFDEAAGGKGPAVPLLVLPVKDAAAFGELVARLARERLGAPGRAEARSGKVQVVSFAARPDGPASLCLGLRDGERVAVLAPGPGCPGAVHAALSRPAAESLAELAAWRELRAALGERPSFLAATLPSRRQEALERDELRLPPGLLPAGLALGASAGPGTLRLVLAAKPGQGTLKGLAAGGDAKGAVKALAPDAALVLRWDGDPAALGRTLLARAPAHDQEWLAAHGLDLQRDLFDQLAPGVAASVSLSPRLDLSGLSDLEARADPLRVVRFELLAEVKDEAAAHQVLSRLPALAAALAEPVEGRKAPAAAEEGGARGRIATPSGEVAWRLDGKRLSLAGGPAGALDALKARANGGKGYAPPSQESGAALSGGLGGLVLAPRSLVASVRALPEEAFGTGPTGFVLRSMAERFLEPAERLSAVSARAALSGELLTVELLVEAPPPGKAKEGAR